MITNSVVANAVNNFTVLAPGQRAADPFDPILQNSTLKPVDAVGSSSRAALPLPKNTRDEDLKVSLSDDGKAAEQRERAEGGEGKQQDSLTQQRAQQEAEARVKAQVEKREQQEIQKIVSELSARDREVRAHEQAHAAVGGQYAGAPTYQYKRGPDGVNYAVGGEVQIDVSPAPTPQETIAKARVVRQAALAPAEPSPQDRRVAAQASQMEAQARAELASENAKKVNEAGQSEVAAEEGAKSAPDGMADEVVKSESKTETDKPATRQSSFERDVATRNSSISSLLGDQMNRLVSSITSEARRPGEVLSQLV